LHFSLLFSAALVALLPAGSASAHDSCPPIDSDPFAGLPFDRGYVVAADYAESAEPVDLWKYVVNGFHTGTDPYESSSDSQIVHWEYGGDPLPGLDGQIHTGYRRMHTDGPQSLWDAEYQPDHTRAQLGGWGRYSNIHISEPGEREFIVYSVRLDPEFVTDSSVIDYTGLYYLSMVSQFKSFDGIQGGGPTISVYEGADGLQFVSRDGDTKHYDRITNVPRGVWLRIGLDVLWSSGDDGSYRWWGDLDGDEIRNFKPLTERRVTPTMTAE